MSNPKNQTHWIVVTDLDGTLLDHHTYSFAEAQATLDKLQQNGIPVVINSSKTAAEIAQLRVALNNKHPFIVENGSGIIMPSDYFPERPEIAEENNNQWQVVLGKPRALLLEALAELPREFTDYYRNYNRCSIDDIVEMTGLSQEEAELSSRRLYTEPLQWLGSEKQKKAFYGQLHQKHIHFTEGGRFIHLMGHTNKGSATSWLKRLYEQAYQNNVKVVALGDGKNDVDMLKAADVAVVIRSPVNPPPAFEHPCKMLTMGLGPVGWSEAIEHLFFSEE